MSKHRKRHKQKQKLARARAKVGPCDHCGEPGKLHRVRLVVDRKVAASWWLDRACAASKVVVATGKGPTGVVVTRRVVREAPGA